MPNQYEMDNQVTMSALFKIGEVATDPTTITLTVKNPSGVSTVYTHPADLDKTGTGAYKKDITVTLAGNWFYKFKGTGTVVAAKEDYFIVQPSEL